MLESSENHKSVFAIASHHQHIIRQIILQGLHHAVHISARYEFNHTDVYGGKAAFVFLWAAIGKVAQKILIAHQQIAIT